MLFSFLKYLQPVTYFSLKREDNSSIYPIYSLLPNNVQHYLEPDLDFVSEHAKAYDLSWQAIQKGYVGDSITYYEFEKIPIIDEYHFIRKYFNQAWVYYVLLIRILSFKNPIRELSYFSKTRHIKRCNLAKNPVIYPDYNQFQSNLIKVNPLVSVIIPTLNRYLYLKDVLSNLEQQDYKNFEVIIVDQSEPFQKEFYKDFKLNIKLIYQEEKALWLARNIAIKQSKGDYILLFDDDSLIDKNWIYEHLKCLDFFQADISSGVSISKAGAKIPDNYSYFLISSQLDTGNVLLPKRVFKQIGLFDRQFEQQRMGDGEFGLRAYLSGLRNISNPYAKRLHLKVNSGGLREMGSWDGFRPKKWFAPRPIPSVLYLYRKYYGNKSARLAMLKIIPSSIMPYRYKSKSYLMLIGSFISILISPIILFQVNKSWQLASKKLKEGDKIEKLSNDRH